MLLLPFEELTIHTHLSCAAVKEHLEAVTASKVTFWQWLGYTRIKKPFVGQVKDDHLNLVLYGKPNARIVCTGTFYKSASGTEIDMVVRPLSILCFAGLIFYCAMIWSVYRLLMLIPKLLLHQPIATGDDLPWWASLLYIIAYLILYLWYRYYANKAKKILCEKLVVK